MSTDSHKTTVSKYRGIYIFILIFSAINYTAHYVLGVVFLSSDNYVHTLIDSLSVRELDTLSASFIGIIFIQLALAGSSLILVSLRQAITFTGILRHQRIINSIMFYGSILLFFASLFFGPLNPDIFGSNDPKLRGMPEWLIALFMMIISGCVTSIAIMLLIDVELVNANSKLRSQK